MSTNSDSVSLHLYGTADVQRDDEFWMEDGSIVLIASDHVAFRVYRGLLAAQSPMFGKMFADSTPCDEEMLEGAPVVHLADSAEDLRYFLRALIHKDRPM